MVVGRSRGAHEHALARHPDQRLESERALVELAGDRNVTDIEHGMVESGDGHQAFLPREIALPLLRAQANYRFFDFGAFERLLPSLAFAPLVFTSLASAPLAFTSLAFAFVFVVRPGRSAATSAA